MPCWNGSGPEHTETWLERYKAERNAKEILALKEELDTYARHLCFACTMLEKMNGKNIWKTLRELPITEDHGNAATELKAWWTAHKKLDAARARKAKAKKT